MEYCFAPLEGVGGAEYRRAHCRWFPGTDKYYMPFVSPTQEHRFTPRELRNISPEANERVPAVPQLLTKSVEDFLWAAGELKAMGYGEVNLNLGCPSGTVVTKGKGAGLLADAEKLDRFLEGIYTKADVPVSLKTRLGLTDPEEFGPLLEVFCKYPVSLLIIHPRVREDYYKHPVRMEYFARAAQDCPIPLCYNGGLFTPEDCERFSGRFPAVERVMMGQGLLADPALIRKVKGLGGLERDALRGFHDQLYHGYLEAFKSERNTVFHMKELWSYLCRLFEGGDKLFKQIKKAQDTAPYEAAVDQIFHTLPLGQEADWT